MSTSHRTGTVAPGATSAAAAAAVSSRAAIPVEVASNQPPAPTTAAAAAGRRCNEIYTELERELEAITRWATELLERMETDVKEKVHELAMAQVGAQASAFELDTTFALRGSSLHGNASDFASHSARKLRLVIEKFEAKAMEHRLAHVSGLERVVDVLAIGPDRYGPIRRHPPHKKRIAGRWMFC